MKIIELLNNLRVPVTNEEQDVLGKFRTEKIIARGDLTEREIVVANQLVNKDVLYRKNANGEITYQKKSRT
jgi:hypothetical protein